MGDNEHVSESKSSVSIARSARGEAQPTVKVYEGTSEEELDRIAALALATFREVVRELGGVS